MAGAPLDTLYSAMLDDASLAVPELINLYERGTEDLRAAVAGMTPAELAARPIPGKWSTLEVVCHLADCEQFNSERLKRTAALEKPLLVGIDPTNYPAALRYELADLEEELKLIELTRRQTARMLRRLPDSVWQRTAIHTEIGLITMRQLLLHPLRHMLHHLPTIAEKRAALLGK
ncbi:DinB family protein [Planctomicrobium piriforme]|uniref:DinB superfamily protein n=1 Tax=Planctomicrobium piriforme TaxID=1576369 RepID=A0A1I3QHT2_9PLAN|nr:DinB family protein [Planctomicrobium piriforme]SFJ33082.1 DinB superfamily protein [Planctomicrobium piriforme]